MGENTSIHRSTKNTILLEFHSNLCWWSKRWYCHRWNQFQELCSPSNVWCWWFKWYRILHVCFISISTLPNTFHLFPLYQIRFISVSTLPNRFISVSTLPNMFHLCFCSSKYILSLFLLYQIRFISVFTLSNTFYSFFEQFDPYDNLILPVYFYHSLIHVLSYIEYVLSIFSSTYFYWRKYVLFVWISLLANTLDLYYINFKEKHIFLLFCVF